MIDTINAENGIKFDRVFEERRMRERVLTPNKENIFKEDAGRDQTLFTSCNVCVVCNQ